MAVPGYVLVEPIIGVASGNVFAIATILVIGGRTAMKRIVVIVLALVVAAPAFGETMNINFVACKSKELAVNVNRMVAAGSEEAAYAVLSGDCLMLPAGTQVFVESHGIEWARVRSQGVSVYVLEKFLK